MRRAIETSGASVARREFSGRGLAISDRPSQDAAESRHSKTRFRLLVAEWQSGGHQASHIAYLVRYLLTEPHELEVLFAIGPALVAELPAEIRTALEDPAVPYCRLQILPVRRVPRLRARNALFRGLYDLCRGLREWFYTKRLALELSVSHVHFLYFDYALFGAALPFQGSGSYTYSGLLFRPTVHYATINKQADRPNEQRRNRLKSLLYRRVLSNPRVAAVFSLDRYFAEFSACHFADGEKVIAVPDPVPVDIERLRAAAPRRSADRVCFLLFGALARRKGVLVVLEALARLADEVAARCHVCFAGRVDPAIREEFHARLEQLTANGASAQVEVFDRFLEDEEIPPLVSGADVILAPYLRHAGSSGLLYWAAAAGKPVITQDFGLIGRETHDFGLGLAVNTLSAADLADAMETAIRANGLGLARGDGQARFIAGHTAADYAATLLGNLPSAGRT